MPFKRTIMRFAHTTGYTHCCYTEDGEYIVSCGSDGDIRIWHGIDDDDPMSQCVGEYIIAIVHHNKRMLASTDLNTVQAYTFPDGDRDGTEFRFTAAVTCITVNKKFMAAGSEDMLIKAMEIGKNEEQFELSGHEGPILHIDISKNGLLASGSGDGTIKIWNMIDKKEIKTIYGFDKVKSFYAAKNFISPTFEPKLGNQLGYINEKEIKIVDTDTWDIITVLKDEKVTTSYSICCYSPCGRYLAAGTCSGEISIWNMKTQRPLKGDTKGTDSQGILSIQWDPKNNGELAYTDNTGQLGTVLNCNDDETFSNVDDFLNTDAIEDDGNDDDVLNNNDDIEFTDNLLDDADDDNDNCISLEKLKNETLKHTTMDLDEKTNRSNSALDDRLSAVNAPIVQFKTYPLQKPFQPSETPRHLEHRYLVWNDVGIVRAHSTDTEESIEVEFHDITMHHGLHMSNHLQHTMGSLSGSVLALACETPSKLVCISLGASGSREWSIALPNCEEIVAIGAGDKLVAIATDQRFLRLFSVMGTQREVLSIAGPIIAIAGRLDKILVTYHNSAATEDQHISMMLIRSIGLSIKCSDIRLPLTPKSKINWIGFTDHGSPVCYDSMGMIRMFNVKGNYWMPILDASINIKNASDNFFIIDVSEENQIVRAILCRGSLYPMTNPKPIVCELKMQIPMCHIEAEKTIFEEELIRSANLNITNSEQKLIGIALKLFALACRTEMESRARELIEMIASPKLLPHAVKYASKIGRMHLADKLSELLPKLEQEEQKREKLLSDVELEAMNMLQNSPMNPVLLVPQKEKIVTPHIGPLIMSQRNPFKKNMKSTLQNKKNPLSHLTKNVIGFDVQPDESQQLFDDIDNTPNTIKSSTTTSTANNSVTLPFNSNLSSSENATNETSTTQITFQAWFAQNKEQLKLAYPDLKPQEYSTMAVRQYKSIYSATKKEKSNTNGNSSWNNGNSNASTSDGGVPPAATKRKLNIDDDDDDNVNNGNGELREQSGIAKLAKFGFKK